MGSRYGNLFGFGPKETDLEKKQRIMRENRRKGKAAEEIIKQRYGLFGYEVEPTGRGSDIHVRRKDIWGNIIESKDIEIKSGNSQLSDLQRKTRQEKRSRYKVERIDLPGFYYKDP